jgi:ABC-2 type transport system ATP-binding protein
MILRQAAAGVTVFFSSHIIPDVEALCDRVAIVVDGRVRAVGTVRDLVSREADRYEVTFAGATPEDLSTRLLAHHVGSGEAWVRVSSGDRDRLLRELADLGARIVSMNPVQATLEDLLMTQGEGAGQ